MTNYKRDASVRLVEKDREITFAETDPEEMLDLVPAAMALGCNVAEAQAIDEELSVRVIRGRGASC